MVRGLGRARPGSKARHTPHRYSTLSTCHRTTGHSTGTVWTASLWKQYGRSVETEPHPHMPTVCAYLKSERGESHETENCCWTVSACRLSLVTASTVRGGRVWMQTLTAALLGSCISGTLLHIATYNLCNFTNLKVIFWLLKRSLEPVISPAASCCSGAVDQWWLAGAQIRRKDHKMNLTFWTNSQKMKSDMCEIYLTYLGVFVLQFSSWFIGADHLFSIYFALTLRLMSLVAISK